MAAGTRARAWSADGGRGRIAGGVIKEAADGLIRTAEVQYSRWSGSGVR